MFHSSAVLMMTELVPRELIYPQDIQYCQAGVLNYLTHDIMFPDPKPSNSELWDFFTAVHCTLWTSLVSLEITLCSPHSTICTVHGLLHQGTFQQAR